MELFKLSKIDGHTLLRLLEAAKSPSSIQILVELPTEAGHLTDSFSIQGDHNSASRLKLMIAALAEKGDLDLPIFTLVLSEYEPSKVFIKEDGPEIDFSVAELKGWDSMDIFQKQQFLLKAVKSRMLLNPKELAQKLDIPPSHLSNVLGAKRKLGWRPMMNLLKKFPWSLKARELVREVMLAGKGVREK